MKCFLTTVDDQIDLVPFFVRHYKRLGASMIPVLTYGSQACHDEVRCVIESLGLETDSVGVLDVEVFHIRPNLEEMNIIDSREGVIRSYMQVNGLIGEWCFHPDLDEFCEVAREDLEALMERSKYGYIAGTWYDRIGPGGRLVDVVADRPLEDQFPLAGEVRNICGYPHSPPCYVAAKFSPSIHHPNSCEIGKQTWSRYHPRDVVRVHHFKWQSSVLQKLESRRHRINKLRALKAAHGMQGQACHQASRVAGLTRLIKHIRMNDGINVNQLETAEKVLNI